MHHRFASYWRPSSPKAVHRTGWWTLWFVLLFLASGPSVLAQTKYQSADEAWNVGVAFYNSRNFAASQEPFEAALKLAPDDAFRVKVCEALIPAYRLLPDTNKIIEACEFIIDKSDSPPKQSLTRRALLSCVFERGKIDELVKRYEDLLRKNKYNATALYILSEVYGNIKRNPERAAELTERLAKIQKKQGQPVNVLQSAELARQYVMAKKFREGAALYEQTAALDEKLAAWHWKEAAAAWLKAGDKKKALAAAEKSSASSPESRSELLAHFWHRGLADVLLAVGQANKAIPHYENAIGKTNIDGYVKGCEKSLAEARKKAGK